MANSYEKFLSFNKSKIKGEHVLVECSIDIDGAQEVSKVLSLNASTELISVEALTSEASVTGNIFINLVYSCQDSSIASNSYNTNFNSKFVDTKISTNSIIMVDAKIDECKVLSVNNNVIKVLCAINIGGDLYCNDEVQYLYGLDSSMCTQTENQDYVELKEKVTNEWLESCEIEAKEQVQTVLLTNVETLVSNVEINSGFATVEGELVARIVYLTDEETPNIKTVFSKMSFKQDIENEHICSGMLETTQLSIAKSKLKTTITEKDGVTKFIIEIPINANCLLFQNNQAQVINDLYSTKNYVNVTNSSYENVKFNQSESFDKKIEGSVSLTDNEPRIDKFIAMSYCNCINSNSYIKDDMVWLEGIISANIIYLNDESNSIHSADVEIPYVISNKTKFENGQDLKTVVTVLESDCMVKKGREIFIDVKINACETEYLHTSEAVISDASENEPLPVRDYGMEIYFAKSGETSWNIGKQIKIEQDIIEKQNPNLIFPLEKDENIAIYYQKAR